MKIGLISDTHNFLDPGVVKVFSGVDHILHAGDVGLSSLIAELEQIAPVTAVTGNTDECLSLRETELVTLSGKRFLIHHIVTPGIIPARVVDRYPNEKPDVLMFGHTHKPFAEQFGPTLFFNPGSAGKKRFGLPRTVAVMEIEDCKITYSFFRLE